MYYQWATAPGRSLNLYIYIFPYRQQLRCIFTLSSSRWWPVTPDRCAVLLRCVLRLRCAHRLRCVTRHRCVLRHKFAPRPRFAPQPRLAHQSNITDSRHRCVQIIYGSVYNKNMAIDLYYSTHYSINLPMMFCKHLTGPFLIHNAWFCYLLDKIDRDS